LKKYLKLVIKSAIAIVLVLVLLATALFIYVDPNDYKNEIAALVKSKTGYSMKIKGNIALSVFPWIGVEVNDVELENPPGFKGKTLAHVARIDIKAKLFPLLSSRLEMSKITARGLQLNLQIDKKGKANWDGARKQAVESTDSDKKSRKVKFNIQGIAVSEASISYLDMKTGDEYHVSDLNLETGAIGAGNLESLSLSLKYKVGKRRKPLAIRYRGKLALDSKKDSLVLSNFTLTLDKARIRGNLKGSNITSQPQLSGSLKSDQINLRTLMAKLGMPLPRMQKKTALQKFSFNSTLAYNNNVVSLPKLTVKFDESTVAGALSLTLGSEIPGFKFKLNLDQIKLDDYMSPASKLTAKNKARPATANDVVIPVKLIRSLRGDGLLSINKLNSLGLDSKGVAVRIVAKKGKLDIYASASNFFSGKYKGHTTINASGRTPRLTIRESLKGVKGEALYKILKPYVGYGGYLHNMTGTASASANFRASGKSAIALRRTLSGAASVDVRNGKLQGINAVSTMCNFYNIFKQRPPIKSKSNATGFEKITAKFKLTNGKFKNDDFVLQTNRSLVRLTGAGNGDIVRDTINYRLKSELIHSACDLKGAEKAAPSERKTEFFVSIKGRLSNPEVKPDFKKAAKAAVKSKLQRKLKKKGINIDNLRDRFKF